MLIVAASMEQELVGLRRELLDIEEATGIKPDVEFHVLGVGPDRSGATLSTLLSNKPSNLKGVLLIGVAGGVDSELETGDLVLADRYALQNGAAQGAGRAISPDGLMFKSAQQAALDLSIPMFNGAALTVDHLVVEIEERQHLRERYQASSVNMEDYRVADAAQKAGVPFVSVRVILDTANQKLPGYLPGLAKSPYKVITNVVLMPWRIPTMLRLKKQLRLCQAVLTNFSLSYMRTTGVIENGRW